MNINIQVDGSLFGAPSNPCKLALLRIKDPNAHESHPLFSHEWASCSTDWRRHIGLRKDHDPEWASHARLHDLGSPAWGGGSDFAATPLR